MKSICLALAFVCFATVSLAQKSFILHYQPKLGFVSVSAGASLPMNNFACRLASNNQSGLARQGTVMSLAAGYRVLGAVGLMGRLQQQTNLMDASALLALPYLQQTDGRVASAGQWTMTTAMFGPYISLPAGRFSFDLRALVGPATAICPANGVEGWHDDVPMAVKTSQGRAGATAYGGGLTVNYRLGRCLAAQINTDYSSASFQFSDMITTMQDGTRTQMAPVDGHKTVSVLNVSAGLTFLFGNRYRPF